MQLLPNYVLTEVKEIFPRAMLAISLKDILCSSILSMIEEKDKEELFSFFSFSLSLPSISSALPD